MKPIRFLPPKPPAAQPVPPPPPMLSTPFETPIDDDRPLAPAPPQMNMPVGPPPPPVAPPEDYEGYIKAALEARSGRSGMEMLWAQLAQADAQNRIAIALEQLMEYLGANDGDGDDAAAPRLQDQIAGGMVDGVLTIKDLVEQIIPAQLISAIKARTAEIMLDGIAPEPTIFDKATKP